MTGFTGLKRLYFYISSFLKKLEIFNPLSAEILILSNIARLSLYTLMLLSMIWITKKLK